MVLLLTAEKMNRWSYIYISNQTLTYPQLKHPIRHSERRSCQTFDSWTCQVGQVSVGKRNSLHESFWRNTHQWARFQIFFLFVCLAGRAVAKEFGYF